MNIFQKLIPAILILIAVPQGLSAMEKSDLEGNQKKGGFMVNRESSLMDSLFSKKGLAVLGTGAAAMVTWLTWSPTRTQQVYSVFNKATDHKGKIAVGLTAAGALYGIYKLVTRAPVEKRQVATVQWRDVVSPIAPPLATDNSATTSTESEVEEPLIMDQAPTEAPEIPGWLTIFISLCEDLYKDVNPERQEEVATPILQMAARNPFDLLSQPVFISLLITNQQKATFIFVLGQYMEAYFQDKITWFMENNVSNIPAMPDDLEELVNNELYSKHLNVDQKQYLALVFQQMATYQRELDKALRTVGITFEVFQAEMQAMLAQAHAMHGAQA